MPRKYPEPTGPDTQTALLAWLFSALGNAYNMLDQYEKQADERDGENRRDAIDRAMSRMRSRLHGDDPIADTEVPEC